MFQRIYIEVGNICNLKCSFCPSTTREQKQMSAAEFEAICIKIKPHTNYIYMHVMGEPLLHPHLDELLTMAHKYDLKVCITTNGTLLRNHEELLLKHGDHIHRISVSLHCMEGNGAHLTMDQYLHNVIDFGKKAAQHGIFMIYRLWNLDSEEGAGANEGNAMIERTLHQAFAGEWTKRWNGFYLADHIFLEYAGIFTWPAQSQADGEDDGYCHGLMDQVAILVDGTVVPCCLDAEGQINLGNIFEQSMDEILQSPRAQRMRDGFSCRKMVEELCKTCTYARRFKK